jgi:acyl carrier protein
MNEEQIRQVILDILARIVPDEDLSDLQDDVPFRQQIELDSMDFLDIVMELRKQYRVQIPEEDYEQLTTMAGTVSYLVPLLNSVESPA